MKTLSLQLQRLWLDQTGSNAIEYSLLGALLAVVCIGVLVQLGDEIVATWTTIETAMSDANAP